MKKKENHSINTWKQWEEKYVKDRKLTTETLADAGRLIRTKNFIITCLTIAIVFMALTIGLLNKAENKMEEW